MTGRGRSWSEKWGRTRVRVGGMGCNLKLSMGINLSKLVDLLSANSEVGKCVRHCPEAVQRKLFVYHSVQLLSSTAAGPVTSHDMGNTLSQIIPWFLWKIYVARKGQCC